LVAVLLAVGVLLPPAGAAATRYAFAQALQFAVLAIVVPALVVIGAPWRLGRWPAHAADRAAIARSHRPGTVRAWAALVGFVATVVIWRLPVVVNTLAWHPVLVVAEAVTLIGAGCGLWLELADSPPLLSRISTPQRAAFAALPMWSIWVLAYIMGFSRGAWFTAFAHRGGPGLGTAADQQIATAILWTVPALCFAPVIFASALRWLRDSSDPDSELREVSAAGQPGALRPPRGWRMPSA
jgi:cytochrome c oxidase assembly factor CtaG